MLVDLSNTFHGAADFVRHALEAVQVPARDFSDDVVQAGLETGCCFLRHGVFDLGQRDAKSQFGGNECQRIPEIHIIMRRIEPCFTCFRLLSQSKESYPVALDARAELLESRALTSMMQYSKEDGCRAYWMLHSPTMPRCRTTLMAVSLSMWYSSLDSVWLGATTMESPEEIHLKS